MSIKEKDLLEMFGAMREMLSNERWEEFYDEQLKLNPEIIKKFKR